MLSFNSVKKILYNFTFTHEFDIISFFLPSIIYKIRTDILYCVIANFEYEQQLTKLNYSTWLLHIPAATDMSVNDDCIADWMVHKVQEKDHILAVHM